MIGILTEKPSAKRNFAKALGGEKGTYNGESYVIVSARGHLYEFVDPHEQVPANLKDKYFSWDIEHLPWNEQDFSWKKDLKKDMPADPKFKGMPKNKDIIATIKAELSKCDELVIATDVDPTGEGQMIAWEIFNAINLPKKKYSRMNFVDEGAASIQKAFKTRQPLPPMLKDPEYMKSDYRSKFDFLTMQFTRIAKSCGDGKSILRQGRLKSAMVVIVGDGLAELAKYKKVPFYFNAFRDENNNMFTNPEEPRFPDKSQVPHQYTNSPVVVDSKTMKTTAPPKLYDLAGLSAALSSKGIKAKDVLATYQKMYEAQIVSYPRTEDSCVTPDQFDELLPFIDKIAKVVGVDKNLLTHRKPRKTHVKVGGAHGANRPGVNVPASLAALGQYGACAAAIYELLAKNYLAILAPDFEYESQKGHLEKYPPFTCTVSVPKVLGFKAVFNANADVDDDDSSTGLGTMASPFVHEGFPPKPPTPTMKWLMAQLEKRNVGTGATRTSVYADVTTASAKLPSLLIETKGKLTMSEHGDMSYYLLQGTNIGDLAMSEQLMLDMKDIAAGKVNADACLARMQKLVKEDCITMEKNGHVMRKALGLTLASGSSTPKEKYTGKFGGKDVSFNRTWSGYRFTDAECAMLCAGKEVSCDKFISAKTGKTFGAKGKLEKQKYNGVTFVGFKVTGWL